MLLSFATVAARNLSSSGPVKMGLAAVAGAIGFSRVYLGVHYPADVAGGLLLGWATGRVWSAVASPLLLGRGASFA